MIHVLDLNFLGFQEAIASFLIETSNGPILIETGPHSTFNVLKDQIKAKGFSVNDIGNVLLTHIHLDHAGAAWALAKQGAKIHVHPFGARHLQSPFKLMESARMIYKDDMDRLWGEMNEISEDQIHVPEDGEDISIGDKTFKTIYSPGHAKHHIAWQLGDIIFTGDVAGVKIGEGPVVPPCPPPDINLEDWLKSIEIIQAKNPRKLLLTHFGEITNIDQHFNQLKETLNDWALWIKVKWEQGYTPDEMTPEFSEYTKNQLRDCGVDEMGVKQYEAANPTWMSVAGLMRYWKKKSEQD